MHFLDFHVISSMFNREKMSNYRFEVFAIDQGLYGPRSQKVQVTITILDINDNAPMFEQYPYRTSISQSHTVGTSVIQVSFKSVDIFLHCFYNYSWNKLGNIQHPMFLQISLSHSSTFN